MDDNIAGLAAESEPLPPQTSFLGWIFLEVLGFYGLMIVVAAVLSFILTWILVRRGRGQFVGLPNQESFLSFILRALGVYVVILPFASCVSIYLTLRILRQGRCPLAASVLLLIIPLPFLFGIFGGFQGILLSFQSNGPSLSFAETADGMGTSMYPPLVGLLLTMPAYAVAVAGTFTRSLSNEAVQIPSTAAPFTSSRSSQSGH